MHKNRKMIGAENESSSKSLAGLVRNAVEEFLPRIAAFGDAKVYAMAADRRRNVCFVAELVFGKELEILWRGFEDKHLAREIYRVDAIFSHHRRSEEIAAQAFFPNFCACVGFPEHGHAGIERGVKVTFLANHRRHVNARRVLPGNFI